MSPLPVPPSFTLSLPKIDLHAHLTGSISPTCLHEIWLLQQQSQSQTKTSSTSSLQDPLIALSPPPGQKHHNILTFFKLFDTYIYTLLNTPSSIAHATRYVLRDFADDGVRYLELRTTPREALATGLTKEVYVETVLGVVEEWNRGEGEERMKCYIILSVDRRNSAEQVERTVDLALKGRGRGVVGLDLCGNPTVPLSYEVLGPAFRRGREGGLELTLHFAEVGASSSVEELEFLLDLGPKRIGHVVHLPPSIEEAVQKRCEQGELGLELCLSCNVLAGMLPGGEGLGFPDHHFGKWFARKGVPVALCTDDVGVFGSMVSQEYALAAEHFGLGREDLVGLARRGVGMIFGGKEEKRRLERLIDEFEENGMDG